MRALVLVIDGLGIGALPDAALYGDAGANTARHICEAVGRVNWPNLRRLGLGNAASILGDSLPGVAAVEEPAADFAALRERSAGKDTTTGHWEPAGIVLDRPLHVFPQEGPAFAEDLLESFRRAFGCGILGNASESGTGIIARPGRKHVESGDPIVYTSADSVFQIAAHESVVPVGRLYTMCQYMRDLCDARGLRVGRIIARPFEGEGGAYRRTARRKDFSVASPRPGLMDVLREGGVETVAVGKITDIFSGRGIDRSYPDKGNPACLDRVDALLAEGMEGDAFIFVNLVDTDMIYGHRRDPRGYYDAVAAIDARLPAMMARLAPGDHLVICADHGRDPTYRGTDHMREHVPLLVHEAGRGGPGRNYGVRSTFADLAQTVAGWYGAGPMAEGEALNGVQK